MKRKFIRTLSLALLTTALLLSKASAGSTPAACTQGAMDACIVGVCASLGVFFGCISKEGMALAECICLTEAMKECTPYFPNANCGTTAMKSQVKKSLEATKQ